VCQPAENVRIASQSIETAHLGMFGTEISQKITYSAAVVTNGVGMERDAQRDDRPLEQMGQWMFYWRTPCAVH